MNDATRPSPAQIDALKQLDTCLVSNAIETFQVRLLNEGFCDGRIRCLLPDRPPMVGYAVTMKIRCSAPPLTRNHFVDRTDWWNCILSVPAPRVIVIRDADPNPGLGALIGEMHAVILRALDCVGVVTDGAVRSLPAYDACGLACFANRLAVSHAYAHIVSIGEPVEIGGLTIHPGDLLHGDRHGVLTIPPQVVADLPGRVACLAEKKRRVAELCRSGLFTRESLQAVIRAT